MLRDREKERRSQEALEDKKLFSEKTPLFAEPYKVMVQAVGGEERRKEGWGGRGELWLCTECSRLEHDKYKHNIFPSASFYFLRVCA